jgi:predicted nuclease with RNAse H fold
VRALGIDVGVGKGLDLVGLDERRIPSPVLGRASLDDVARTLDEYRPDVVAVDSPPSWAAAGRSRLTENELARLNIHAFRTPSPEHGTGPQFNWMRSGMAVFELVGALGYPLFNGGTFRRRAIEVFPHATAAVLAGCLPPKGMRKRVWRAHVLRLQRVRTEQLTTVDRLDAALAALTGLLVLDGHASFLGDMKEGVIVVPSRALAPKYRAGRLADDGSAQLFTWCACGDAACERQVLAGREFAPGHDAKRKSRLWRQAREGQDAIEELRRRRWELPPEMT